MKRKFSITFLLFSGLCLILITTARSNRSPVLAQGFQGQGEGQTLYVPIAANAAFDKLELTAAWTAETGGAAYVAFPPQGEIEHHVTGNNRASAAITVTMQITESGLCNSGLVFSSTVSLPSGPWEHTTTAPAPPCSGVYTATTKLTFEGEAPAISAQYAINDPVQFVLNHDQGIDRCFPPSVDELQTWWDQSPYKVINIYIGGVHYPSSCQDPDQDALWVNEVAAQGWLFTATWVGPQAPCTGFLHKINANPSLAYPQGKNEARLAAEAAREFGLFGDLTLIYDVEGYGGNTACRNAVQAFVQGWTDEIHALGFQAGVYGSPCNSFISDWNNNNPTPDQVWIAHWAFSGYDPTATVWNVPCSVTNSMWAQNQRVKQYAGDHTETWGEVSLTVDSNVFETSVIGWEDPEAEGGSSDLVQDFGVTGSNSGWILVNGRLLRTEDLGRSWADITPDGFIAAGTAFQSEATGWTVGWNDQKNGLTIARTNDYGETWQLSLIEASLDPTNTSAVFIDAVDSNHLLVAVKLQTGSSFSLGRLFASEDAGATWTERSMPLGERVYFEDEWTGWTLGGPAGDEAFKTVDGGWTWTPVEISDFPVPDAILNPPNGTIKTAVLDDGITWALAQTGACFGEKAFQNCVLNETIWVTLDGGLTWSSIEVPVSFDG